LIKHERSPEPFVRAVKRQAPVTEVQVLKPGEPQSSAQRGPDERRGEAVRNAVGNAAVVRRLYEGMNAYDAFDRAVFAAYGWPEGSGNARRS
jgi:hypothetical protein